MGPALNLVVDFCSRDAAAFACRRWHYSGKVPNGKCVTLGVWEDQRFVGAVVFGDGANPVLFDPYGLSYEQGAELVRVALSTHRAPVSQIVPRAIRLLRVTSPGLRLLVSFADPEQGHVGTVYQAMNWVYAGRTLVSDEYLVRGRRFHGRALRSTRSTHTLRDLEAENILDWTRKVLDPDARRIEGSSKHRYLFPLDRAMRRQIAPLALPYPEPGS